MSKPKQKNRLKGKTSPTATSLHRVHWLLLAAVLTVTFILYYPAVNYEFVNWDDDINVTQNRNVERLTTETVGNMFTSTVIGGYTPLTTLSFAIENHLMGMEPWHFHLINILLHVACTALAFFFLRQMRFSLFIGFAVTLLFALHPLRVESVAWVTERKDLLYSLFFLIALIFYAKWYQSRLKWHYAVALLSFILSLLSKIQAVSLPLALLMVDYFFEKRFHLRQVWNKVPFFILSLVTGLAGILFLQEEGSLETSTILPFFQRFFIGSHTLLVYMAKAVIPYEMSAIYPFPAQLNGWHFLSMPAIILLAFLIWKLKKFRTEIIFGALFFLANVIFMVQVVGAGQGYIADRFTYIPYLGLFFIMAFLAETAAQGKASHVVIGAGLVYCLILGVITHNRIKVWENSETLFTDVLKKYPRVPVAYNNMGRWFREQKQYDKAIAAYDKALEIKPESHMTLSNRGKAYFDIGQNDKAIADFNRSIELNDKYPEALSNRGAALSLKGQYEEAIRDLDKAIALEPGMTTALSNRALTYYNLGRFENSIADITAYLRHKPGDADMINLRALGYSQLNKNREAQADYDLAIELNPSQGIFWQNRSFFLNKTGDRSGALRDIRQAERLGVRINPDYVKMLEQK